FGEFFLESTWGLPLPAVKVEQVELDHPVEVLRKLIVDLLHDSCATAHESIDVIEGGQWRPAFRVDAHVPWHELVEPHLPLPFLVDLAAQRDEILLHRIMEGLTVLRSVVEPVLLSERVVAEIGEACV